MLGRLLDGMLEPLVEDRLTAQEALDLIDGKVWGCAWGLAWTWGQGMSRGGSRVAEPPSNSTQARTHRPSRPAGAPSTQTKARPKPARSAAPSPQTVVMLPDGRVYGLPQQQLPAAGKVRKPAGSRVQLTRTSGKLDIEIPPEGISGSSVSTGVFAVVWNAFVAFWTVSALASGGVMFALFSAPFWFAGAGRLGTAGRAGSWVGWPVPRGTWQWGRGGGLLSCLCSPMPCFEQVSMPRTPPPIHTQAGSWRARHLAAP